MQRVTAIAAALPRPFRHAWPRRRRRRARCGVFQVGGSLIDRSAHERHCLTIVDAVR